jgi:hypothetical protein
MAMCSDWTNLRWHERITALFLVSMVAGVFFAGGLLMVGGAVDGAARYSSERDRCLKNAINGYEIKLCR